MIGGGVAGICTAYFLAAAGHDVAVIERHASVAEEASFGHAGVIAPATVAPWAMPGTLTNRLASLWRRQSRDEADAQRFQLNRERMQRVAFYSQHILQELVEQHQMDYEQTRGVLQLFRTEKELALSAPLRELLAEQNVAHQLLDAAAARTVEPGLAPDTLLAGALYLPDGEAGNCALFAKQLRQVAQALGVQFHFQINVDAIQPDSAGIDLRIGAETVRADAVVLAAGADSAQLLRPLGIELPLHSVSGYSITLPIRNFEAAPLAALTDEAHKVAITRLGNRVRVAGMAELGARGAAETEQALRTLATVANDWFPGAAGYQGATPWCGVRPTLPDGPPLLGATRIKNLFVNIGHGASGWAMAAGSGKILADVISQRAPDIDLDGLTMARYG